MKQICEVVLVILLAGVCALAGEKKVEEQAQPAARVLVEKANGKVNADRVNIRSGPTTSHNIILTVDKDTALTVRSFREGWYEIDLPKGAGCWIYKEYVKVEAPETGFEAGAALPGVITGTDVRLRSSPDMLSSSVLVDMKKGDKVEIIGKSGDWFKVRPPEGTVGWISARYVTLEPGVRVSGELIPEQAARAVLPDASEVPLPTSTGASLPSLPVPGTAPLPPLGNMSKAEHLLTEELKKPPIERNFSEAIALYNRILTSSASTAEEKKAAQARLRQIFTLTPRRELASYMLDLSRTLEDELQKAQKRYEPQIEALRARIPPARYTARGVLYRSSGDSAGFRYRLKMGDVTLYLVRAPGQKYDFLLGSEVGVIGEVQPPPPGFDIEAIDVTSMEPIR